MNRYDKVDKPRLKVTFKVNGVETDPTAAVIIVKLPDGTFQSFLSQSGFTSQGAWDAENNSPVLENGSGVVGHYYTVNVAGSQNLGHELQTFDVGDLVAYDGDTWLWIPSPQTETLTKEGNGVYRYDYPVHIDGTHYYRGEGFGIVHAAIENFFIVDKSKIRN